MLDIAELIPTEEMRIMFTLSTQQACIDKLWPTNSNITA